MSNLSREQRLDNTLDEMIENMDMSSAHRDLIQSFRSGDPLHETNAQDLRDFVDDLVRIQFGEAEITAELKDYVTAKLRSARLDHSLAFPETILHRLADCPMAAIKQIEARDADLSERTAKIAKSPRLSRHDWWSAQIGDYVEDHPQAVPEDVRKYLLQIEGVSVLNGVFRYAGQDKAMGLEIESISNAQVRSKTFAAKKRYTA